ncbi:MAG: SEC-C domain-containing protein [Elusimicrobia bacterium]|nr:SEC-C domain-containing protein [Elusimicrobiota bacterium]
MKPRDAMKSAAEIRSSIRQAICAFANDMPNHNLPGVVFIGAKDDGSCAGLRITDEDLPYDLHPFAAASMEDLDVDAFKRLYLPAAIAPEVLRQNQRTAEQAGAEETRSARRISRSSPCPCGSGRKYKKCCMRLEGICLHPDILRLLNGQDVETRAQMVDFAQPLLDSAQRSPKAREAAFLASMLFWFAALGGRDFAVAELPRIEERICESDDERRAYRVTARMMFERYQDMRPDCGYDPVAVVEEVWGKNLDAGLGKSGWMQSALDKLRSALTRDGSR